MTGQRGGVRVSAHARRLLKRTVPNGTFREGRISAFVYDHQVKPNQ